MSIAEKLQTIAENEQRVYDAGYAKGQAEGGDTTAAYDEGFEAGKKAEYDILWDSIQVKGKRSHYVNAFAYTGWNDKIYNPKYPISPAATTGITAMFFWNQEITDTKVPITAYGGASQAFANAANIKRIPKLIFNGCTDVRNMFLGCSALEELYCEGTLDIDGLNLKDCKKLNKASFESIVRVYSTTVKGLSCTFSEQARAAAFTDEEWEALRAERPDVTFYFV